MYYNKQHQEHRRYLQPASPLLLQLQFDCTTHEDTGFHFRCNIVPTHHTHSNYFFFWYYFFPPFFFFPFFVSDSPLLSLLSLIRSYPVHTVRTHTTTTITVTASRNNTTTEGKTFTSATCFSSNNFVPGIRKSETRRYTKQQTSQIKDEFRSECRKRASRGDYHW